MHLSLGEYLKNYKGALVVPAMELWLGTTTLEAAALYFGCVIIFKTQATLRRYILWEKETIF